MYEDIILKMRKLMKSEGYDQIDCLAISSILHKNYLERVISSDDDVDFDEDNDESDSDLVDEEDESDEDLADEDEMEKLVDDMPDEELDDEVLDEEEPEEIEKKEEYKVSIKRPNMGREK